MKKHILAALFLSISFAASAQLLYREQDVYSDETYKTITFEDSLNNKKVNYIMLSMAVKSKADKTYFGIIDFGSGQLWSLADKTGKDSRAFSSLIEVFNHLDANGWEFVAVVEDTRTTALWAKLIFDVTTVRTRMAYIFKRKS